MTSAANAWPRVRLGDVCEIVARQVDPRLPEFGCLPHVNGENIESGTCRLLAVRSAAEDGMISGKYLFEPGDVLYSKLRPYLRKAVVADFRGLCSADMYPIRVRPDALDPHFLAWMLISGEFADYADEESRRARMPKLNREQLFSFMAALPSVGEQQRIVNEIQEAMAVVDRAHVAAKTQIFAAADLQMGLLRSVFESQTAASWPRMRLDKVCEIRLGKMLSPNSRTGIRSRPYLRNANVQWNQFDLREVLTMDFTVDEEERFALKTGDLLVCEGGEPGRAAVWEGQFAPCFYQKALHRLRPISGAVDPYFVMFRLRYGAFKGEFQGSEAKTTIAHLPAIRLAGLVIGVPDLSTQIRAVERLASGAEMTRRLLDAATDQAAAFSALSNSIVRRAFSGGL